MTDNLQKAKALLEDGCTFAAVGKDGVITSREHGIKPLMKLLDSGKSLKDYSVADKVVGKAAAFLYAMLLPDVLYVKVISKPALDVLRANGIKTEYETCCEAIKNRDNTGFCPMETAVMQTDVNDIQGALKIIGNKIT